MKDKLKVLVVSPHFDDFALAIGGTIIILKERIDVNILLVTKPFTEEQETESKNALDYLKIPNYQFPYKTVTLDTIPKRNIIDNLTIILNSLEPNVIFTNHPNDYHTDHKIVAECMNVATRPYLMNKIENFIVYHYETSCKAENINAPFIPNFYISLDKKTFDKKIELVKHFNTELREGGHPRSIGGITALAKYRGSQIGREYAEAFSLFRGVVDWL